MPAVADSNRASVLELQRARRCSRYVVLHRMLQLWFVAAIVAATSTETVNILPSYLENSNELSTTGRRIHSWTSTFASSCTGNECRAGQCVADSREMVNAAGNLPYRRLRTCLR